MKNRLKQIRKGVKMTQSEFAEDLGVGVASIASYENGRRTPVAAFISLVCSKYGINETWLLTGEGDMHSQSDHEQVVASITAQLYKEGDSSFRMKLIKLVSQMTEEQIQMCQDLVNKLIEEDQ